MAQYLTPDEYGSAVVQENYSDDHEYPADLDERTDPPARYRDVRGWLAQGFTAGLTAAREINDTYTVLAMVPISRVGNVADELAIVAWDPTGGHDGRGKAVSAWVRSLPARNWNHGEYFEDPADEPFQRVQRAVADMLRRAAWPIPASDDDI